MPTRRTIADVGAPSAMRIPISRVRPALVQAITPYNPIPDSSIAASANAASALSANRASAVASATYSFIVRIARTGRPGPSASTAVLIALASALASPLPRTTRFMFDAAIWYGR